MPRVRLEVPVVPHRHPVLDRGRRCPFRACAVQPPDVPHVDEPAEVARRHHAAGEAHAADKVLRVAEHQEALKQGFCVLLLLLLFTQYFLEKAVVTVAAAAAVAVAVAVFVVCAALAAAVVAVAFAVFNVFFAFAAGTSATAIAFLHAESIIQLFIMLQPLATSDPPQTCAASKFHSLTVPS